MNRFLALVCAILFIMVCSLLKCSKDEPEINDTRVHIITDGEKHLEGNFRDLDLQLKNSLISPENTYLYNLSSQSVVIYEVAYSKNGKTTNSRRAPVIVVPNEIVKFNNSDCRYFMTPPMSIKTRSTSKDIVWITYINYRDAVSTYW